MAAKNAKTNSCRALEAPSVTDRQESRAAGPLLTAAPLISTDHPLVSITVTRAPAARPPPSLDRPFYPLLLLPLMLRSAPPCLLVADGEHRSAQCRKTAPQMHRTRRRIHSVLLLLRIPSRVRLVPRSGIFQGSRSTKSLEDLCPAGSISPLRVDFAPARSFLALRLRCVAISRLRKSRSRTVSTGEREEPRPVCTV